MKPLRFSHLAKLASAGADAAVQLETARWALGQPASLADLPMGLSGLDLSVKGERITEAVRRDFEASEVYMEFARTAVDPYSPTEPLLIDEALATAYEPLITLLQGLLENHFLQVMGVDVVQIYDFDLKQQIPDIKTFKKWVRSYAFEDDHGQDRWEASFIFDIERVVENLLILFRSRGLEVADFFVRNQVAISSVIIRTEEKTIYGKTNTNEINAALQKFAKQRLPNNGFHGEVLRTLGEEAAAPVSYVTETGHDFEKRCADILIGSGHRVQITPASGDKGVDLLIDTDEYRVAVQCKLLSKPAGVKAVQEVSAGARFYKTDYALVICDAGFTSAAEELAASCGVLLGNTKTLGKLSSII